MRQKKTIIGVAIFFTICLALYAYLGGLQEISVDYVEAEGFHIIGKEYQGKFESDTMRNIFLETKKMADSGRGTLVVLYYKDAEEGNEEIKCFTGLLVEKAPDDVPFDMEYRFFNSDGVVRARFEGHRLVTPNPATIKQKVAAFAKEKDLELQPLFMEKYFSNNAIEVDYLIE